MALSSGGNEIKTATINAVPSAGSTTTMQLDAQEDREIVGFNWEMRSVGAGDDGGAVGEAFTGVEPSNSGGSAQDLGGKFYSRVETLLNIDDTNGNSQEILPLDGMSMKPDGLAWDWNEDVTLTLKVRRISGAGAWGFELQVYYREV